MLEIKRLLDPRIAAIAAAPIAIAILASCGSGGGDAALIRHCTPALMAPPSQPGYANTTWPTEHRDKWRTHAAAAGLPGGITSDRLTVTAAETPPTPTWGYLGADGKVYVLGGAPFLLDVYASMILGAPRDQLPALIAQSKVTSGVVTPYLARIDPTTMKVDKLDLSGGASVNYVGGALVHSNGFLYAIARGVLFKIDPTGFQVVQSKQLPLPNDTSTGQPNQNTAYNGMQAIDNGDLILKGFASISPGTTPAILLRVSATDLSILAQLETSAVADARLTIANIGAQEYLYLPGQTSSLRFRLDPNAFVPDDSYTQPYLGAGDGSTPASSDVFMGNGVIFANNTEPQATIPMRLFGETASGSTLGNIAAFVSANAGWNFFMVAGDPFRLGIVVVEDQLNGQISGFVACADGKTVEKLWENDSLAVSAGAAIAYDRGQLYVDDRRCATNGSCQLFLVVLDLVTGLETARVAVKGAKPSIGQIFIGPDSAVYFPATDTGNLVGYVNRVTGN